jgi:hypothetical protein
VSDSQFAGLEILLRQPTAPFTAADLVGQWEYRDLEVPKAVSAPSLTPGTPLNGAFSVETNRFTFTPNGLVPNAGQWQLVWSGGILESAPTPSGPGNPVTGATSPRTLVSDGAGACFRVSSP